MTTHAVRWTLEKIQGRLALIEPLVYRRRAPLPPFRYRALPDDLAAPDIGVDVDDSAWETLVPPAYWGRPRTNFVLRTRVSVPADWPAEGPAALYLPLGQSGDFSHPETLAYLDGRPYAAGDRHHQEIRLPAECRDGRPHTLALHGWTGIVADSPQLLMRPCFVVQVDSAAREFVALARVALGTGGRSRPTTRPTDNCSAPWTPPSSDSTRGSRSGMTSTTVCRRPWRR